jgi:histone deacetylase complex regulatory component SIN3
MQFLEILIICAREHAPIQDVFNEVTRLLQSAPDLVEGFKQFLPESTLRQTKNPEGSADEESSDEETVAIGQRKCLS